MTIKKLDHVSVVVDDLAAAGGSRRLKVVDQIAVEPAIICARRATS